jgi:hypothetical protein
VSDDLEVFFSDVGSGEDARRIAHVAGWTLTQFTGRKSEEPMLHDAELCARIEYSSVYRLRQRARELMRNDPYFRPLEVSTAAVETGGRPGKEMWFGEYEMLLLCTRIDTPIARRVTSAVIRLVMAVRKGIIANRVASARQLEGDNTRLRTERDAAIARADRAERDAIAARVAEQQLRRDLDAGGVLGRVREAVVLEHLRTIASLTAEHGTREWRVARREAEKELRRLMNYRSKWRWLALDREHELTRFRTKVENDTHEQLVVTAAARQLVLFDVRRSGERGSA